MNTMIPTNRDKIRRRFKTRRVRSYFLNKFDKSWRGKAETILTAIIRDSVLINRHNLGSTKLRTPKAVHTPAGYPCVRHTLFIPDLIGEPFMPLHSIPAENFIKPHGMSTTGRYNQISEQAIRKLILENELPPITIEPYDNHSEQQR